ncbi:HNH endonuclease [Corynebacterium lubricantis]|uniref:HNH endonuclease n=1 Tax=Corynebacterium lubricantis TaxID=541095 RepID=UPI0003687275|nr:HNH endonuclease signature motif containing protein [Corynebacterium lubricantis]
MPKTINHGTRQGYDKHIREKTPTCQPCKDAQAAYMREKRKNNPEQNKKQRERERTRNNERYQEYKANPEQHERLKRNWQKKNRTREVKPEWEERNRQREEERKREHKAWLKTPEGQAWRKQRDQENKTRREQQLATRRKEREAWLQTPEGIAHEQAHLERERSRWRKKAMLRYERSKVLGSPEYGRALYQRAKRRIVERGQRSAGRAATGWELKQRLIYFKHSCWICSCHVDEGSLTWDHVKPISRGGSLLASNLRPACAECNSFKRDVWPLTKEFLEEIRKHKNNLIEEEKVS